MAAILPHETKFIVSLCSENFFDISISRTYSRWCMTIVCRRHKRPLLKMSALYITLIMIMEIYCNNSVLYGFAAKIASPDFFCMFVSFTISRLPLIYIFKTFLWMKYVSYWYWFVVWEFLFLTLKKLKKSRLLVTFHH